MLIYPNIIMFIMFTILIIVRDIIINSEYDDGDVGGKLVAVLGTVHLPR